MIQALYTGVSGLQVSQRAMDVEGNNLSNLSTIGFRAQRVEFATLFDDAKNEVDPNGSIDSTVGIGSRVNATTTDLSMGALLDTESNTNLAIAGDGWFGVEDGNQRYFTRNGNFTFDVNRDLVMADSGMYVLGTIGKNINFNTQELTEEIDAIPLEDIKQQKKLRLPNTLTSPAKATENTSFFGNLGTEDTTRVMSAKIYDVDGNTLKLKLTFTKAKEQPEQGIKWNVKAVLTTKEEKEGDPIYATSDGDVTFNEKGALTKSTLTNIAYNGSNINIDLGKGFDGVTAIANVPVTASSKSDGHEKGELIGYEIAKDAEILATFTNGRQSSVGRVGVFHFQNDQGLNRISGSLFAESDNSGKAIIFKDQDGNNILGASVLNKKLENSNVKIENGLTQLIILQRSYQANGKIVTTADQMIQKALNMDA